MITKLKHGPPQIPGIISVAEVELTLRSTEPLKGMLKGNYAQVGRRRQIS